MKQVRRMAVNGTLQREMLVEAAEFLLREEGSSAITARRVTAQAGLKSQLLYYYFETMDDLILGVVQRVAERRLARFEAALASAEPLDAMWKLNSDPTAATLSAELISLAGHRESIRAEIVRNAADFRAKQTSALERLLAHTGIDQGDYPADGLVLIASAVARIISTEAALGFTDGHHAALKIIHRAITRYEKPARESDTDATGQAHIGAN